MSEPAAVYLPPQERTVDLGVCSLRIIPRRETIEVWVAGDTTDCRSLIVVDADQAADLESAIAWARNALDRNLRVLAPDPGVYPRKQKGAKKK